MNTPLWDAAPTLARGELWLLVSAASIDPYHRKRLERIRDSAFRSRVTRAAELVKLEGSATELGPGERSPSELEPRALFAACDAQWQSLEPTYRALFGLTAISLRCPACETEYEPNPDLAYRSQRLADVSGFYRAFGMRIASQARERVDHVTVETEFLHLLSIKEGVALQTGNVEGAEICRDARRKFFVEHVGWWLPAFCRLLSRVAPPGFYRTLANLTAALSAAERIAHGMHPLRGPTVPTPAGLEPRGACFECSGSECSDGRCAPPDCDIGGVSGDGPLGSVSGL